MAFVTLRNDGDWMKRLRPLPVREERMSQVNPYPAKNDASNSRKKGGNKKLSNLSKLGMNPIIKLHKIVSFSREQHNTGCSHSLTDFQRHTTNDVSKSNEKKRKRVETSTVTQKRHRISPVDVSASEQGSTGCSHSLTDFQRHTTNDVSKSNEKKRKRVETSTVTQKRHRVSPVDVSASGFPILTWGSDCSFNDPYLKNVNDLKKFEELWNNQEKENVKNEAPYLPENINTLEKNIHINKQHYQETDSCGSKLRKGTEKSNPTSSELIKNVTSDSKIEGFMCDREATKLFCSKNETFCFFVPKDTVPVSMFLKLLNDQAFYSVQEVTQAGIKIQASVELLKNLLEDNSTDATTLEIQATQARKLNLINSQESLPMFNKHVCKAKSQSFADVNECQDKTTYQQLSTSSSQESNWLEADKDFDEDLAHVRYVVPVSLKENTETQNLRARFSSRISRKEALSSYKILECNQKLLDSFEQAIYDLDTQRWPYDLIKFKEYARQLETFSIFLPANGIPIRVLLRFLGKYSVYRISKFGKDMVEVQVDNEMLNHIVNDDTVEDFEFVGTAAELRYEEKCNSTDGLKGFNPAEDIVEKALRQAFGQENLQQSNQDILEEGNDGFEKHSCSTV